MKKTSLSSVLMITLAGTLAVAGCKKQEETAPPPMEQPPRKLTRRTGPRGVRKRLWKAAGKTRPPKG